MFFWIYFTATVIGIVVTTVEEQIVIDSENQKASLEYINCAYKSYPEKHSCDMRNYIDYPPFWLYFTVSLLENCFPIAVFFVFGFRQSMLLYWKEYFKNAWQHKSIPLQFNASFDCSSLSKGDLNSVGTGSVESERAKEEKATRRYLKKLRKRLREI